MTIAAAVTGLLLITAGLALLSAPLALMFVGAVLFGGAALFHEWN